MNISSVLDQRRRAGCCVLFGIQVRVISNIRVEQTHAFYHFLSVVDSLRKPYTTPRTLPDRSAKLLCLQRLLRTFCCRSPAMSLLIRRLNAFLRKKKNTHVYLRNSRPHFAYVERRISEFIDRFLWIRS